MIAFASILGRFCAASCFCLFAATPISGLSQETAGSEDAFLSAIRPLTLEGRRSGEGYFAEDGRALIFQSEREPGNPFYQIYLLDLETGDSHRVSPGTGKTTCAFFRPGTDEVLFASTHQDPEVLAKQKAELEFRASGQSRRYAWDYDETMDIYSARRDGTQIRRLTDTLGYDAEASYSPDGRLIVFCSLRSAYPTNALPSDALKRWETDPSWFGEIYLMNADGSQQRRLTTVPGYDGGPFFSPDGKRILWRRFSQDGVTADVYTMNLDGSDVRRLTDFGSMSWAPYFHPSGRYIIFTANKLGFANFELYVVDAQGQHQPVRVTFRDGFDGLPVFSPDGRKLCWTSSRTAGGQSQLFLADWNHDAMSQALKTAPARASSVPPPSPAQTSNSIAAASFVPGITTNDLRRQVAFLASPELGGRMTGSDGARRAAGYIADQLRTAGLSSVPSMDGMFQPFEFTADVRVVPKDNRLTLTATNQPAVAFALEKDFRPLSFTANAVAEGEVVFAGYGLAVPGPSGEGYDSYAGLNVSNKIVLALRYVPEGVEAKRRSDLNRYAGLRYKAMLARDHGARAILFVTGPNAPDAGALAGLSFDGSLAGSDILAATISSNVVAALLRPSGRDLLKLQTDLDQENPHAEGGFVLPGVRVTLAASVEQVTKSDKNVLAMIPASGQGGEFVLIGAHYDHLGYGESGAMRRAGEEHQIHPGADDNASGVAAVLELASALAQERQRHPERFARGVLVALWSGEELGLLGSSHFAEHPVIRLSNVVAFLNFDMVGRLRENKLSLQGVGSSTQWRRMIEKRNVAAGFNLNLQDDPYLPTDVTALYPKGVPVLNFFTGSHEEYHRPADTAETLNYDGLERIAKLAFSLVRDLAWDVARPDYVRVARSDSGGGERERLRVYLGTIPDYAAEVQGVKLSGVRAGGPAEKAGLRGGDLIVEFGGRKIANIYDYTYALNAVKVGKAVSIVVLREGQRVALEVMPEVRK